MGKRIVPFLTLAIVAGGFASAPAECVTATVTVNPLTAGLVYPALAQNRAGMTFDDGGSTVSITMSEVNGNTACSDGSVVQTDPERHFLLTRGGVPVCDLTGADGIDPSFDPFGFGAGFQRTVDEDPDDEIPPQPFGACGASFSMASLTNPLIPNPDSVEADPGEPAVQVGFRKDVVTEVAGKYWWTDAGGYHLGVVPQDTAGWVERELRVTAS